MLSFLFAIGALFVGIAIGTLILNVLIAIPIRIFKSFSSDSRYLEPQADETMKPLIEPEPRVYMSHDDYKRYLLSDDWKIKRKARLFIDEYTCQYCYSILIDSEQNTDHISISDNHIPNVHHIHYHRLGKENVDTDLVSLCKRCHLALHDMYDLTSMEYKINKQRGITLK